MALYSVDDNGEIAEYSRLDMPLEKDIEDFLHRHPEVVEKDIMIVGRQIQTDGLGRIDLLGMDRDGNVVVIEIKKGDASREVVSQILHYAVWARDIEYNDLNKAYNKLIKTHGDLGKTGGVSGGRPDLHAAVENRFGMVPQSFNPGQRLYVVGEGIEQKTDDICTYLRQNGLKIRCVSVEFFSDGGGDGKNIRDRIRVVHTDVATERQDDGGAFDKWDYNMSHCDAEISKAINDVISYMEKELKCPGKVSKTAATCTFYAGGDHARGTRFAVIYAYKTKDYGGFDFLSDPHHDFHDDRVSPATYTFGDIGRTVKIVPENVDLILKCARHARDTAKGTSTGSG